MQHPLPVVIGGTGPRRTPALAARFAAEYNVPFARLNRIAACFDRVRRACEESGRDPASLLLSAAQTLAIGRDEAEVTRRAAYVGSSAADSRSGGLGGTVSEVVDKLGRLGELGASRIYLQLMDLDDLDQLRLVASEVVPRI